MKHVPASFTVVSVEHQFTCSCVDSAVHSTVCKHCHLVQLCYIKKDTAVSISHIPERDLNVNNLEHFSKSLMTESPLQMETLKQKLKFLLEEIQIQLKVLMC